MQKKTGASWGCIEICIWLLILAILMIFVIDWALFDSGLLNKVLDSLPEISKK